MGKSFLKLSSDNLALPFTKGRTILTVSELTRRIKLCLEQEISYIWVTGEVSNLRQPGSGHIYFSLKDVWSQIRCVLFAGTARAIKFKIEDGLQLIIFGRVSVYEKSGEYQIIIDRVEPKGIGALQLALAQLKERLSQEGLFDPEHKKTLPLLPKRLGIVTSPTGAALRDILKIINRRFPEVGILIYPVRVQGDGASAEIAQAIKDMNSFTDLEVLIIARGGGSQEDLWTFNDEAIARSIFNSRIPVISAVGHEIDLTIADLVADKRVATPSEAAESVVPSKQELLTRLDQYHKLLVQSLQNRVSLARTRLEALKNSYALQQPFDRLRQMSQQLDELYLRLPQTFRKIIEKTRRHIAHLTARMETLSPLNVLKRGYSITKLMENNKILTSVSNLAPGESILTQLAKGRFISEVKKILP